MIALRRLQRLAYATIGSIVVAFSCAKAEDSPLADRGGGDDEGGESGGGKAGTAGQGGSSGSIGSGGTAATAGQGGSTSTGGTAGKGGSTSTGGKGGSTSTGGSGGSTNTTHGCLDGEGGQGGAGGTPGEAGAGGSGPTTLFTDDFEDGNANGWVPTSGSWTVVAEDSDAYEQSDAGETDQYISAVTGTCWADQIVEARVKVVDFNGNSTSYAASLFARYVSADTHYMIGMNSGNNGEFFIGRRIRSTSNQPERFARKTNMGWAEGRWYTLRLEVVGTSLKAYVDDVLQIEATDAQITSGGVAVGARHAAVRFDDVRVTRP